VRERGAQRKTSENIFTRPRLLVRPSATSTATRPPVRRRLYHLSSSRDAAFIDMQRSLPHYHAVCEACAAQHHERRLAAALMQVRAAVRVRQPRRPYYAHHAVC